MDTIIIQDVRFRPKLPDFTEDDRFMVEFLLDDMVFGSTKFVARNTTDMIWHFEEIFLVPIITNQNLKFNFFQSRTTQGKLLWGSVDVDTLELSEDSDGSKRLSKMDLVLPDGKSVAEIEFSSSLSTSNYSAKKSPRAVIEAVKSMYSEQLMALLTQITLSDLTCVNADIALIHTIHKALHELADDMVDKPRGLTLLANMLALRYDFYLQIATEAEKFSGSMFAIYKNGLQNALILLEKADLLADVDHPKRPWILISLCMCLQRFIVEPRRGLDGHAPYLIKLMDVVLRLADAEPQKRLLLSFLAGALQRKHAETLSLEDMNNTIKVLEHAIDCSGEDSAKYTFVVDLSNALRLRFQRYQVSGDVSLVLSHSREALHLLPDIGEAKALLLTHLAIAYSSGFVPSREVEMNKISIDLFNEALPLIPDSNVLKISTLRNLAQSLRKHMRQLGDLAPPDSHSMLQQTLENALRLCPVDNEQKSGCLIDLASVILEGPKMPDTAEDKFLESVLPLFNEALSSCQTGSLESMAFLCRRLSSILDQCVDFLKFPEFYGFLKRYHEIVTLRMPDVYAPKPDFLFQLGVTFGHIPDSEHKADGIQRAIILFEDVYRLRRELNLADGDPKYRSEHGQAYLTLFKLSGDIDHLNKGISLVEQATSNVPSLPSAMKAAALNKLSCALLSRFYRCGNVDDIYQGITVLQDAAFLVADFEKPTSEDFYSDFDYFVNHLEQFVGVADLDIVVKELETEVDSLSDASTIGTSLRLENLGMYLSIRLKKMSDTSRIPESTLCTILEVTRRVPDAYPRKAMWLHMTSGFLLPKSKPPIDLALAIEYLEHAVRLTSDGRSPHAQVSNSLACSLLKRFECFGNIADINSAINTLEDALQLCPDNSNMRPNLVGNLSVSLLARYRQLGDLSDFNASCDAVSAARGLLIGSGDRSTVAVINSNIALILMNQTVLVGSLTHINESIELYQAQLNDMLLRTPSNLCNCATSLLQRFRLVNDVSDIDLALEFIEEAFKMSDDISPVEKASILKNQASALSQRFVCLSEIADINKCIALLQEAEQLIGNSHPVLKSQVMFDLGRWLPVRFTLLGDDQDLETAFSYLKASASSIATPIHWRFRAASLLAHWLRYFQRGSPLSAYSMSIDLLPRLAWFGLSIPNRHQRLWEASAEVVDAVAAAIDENQFETAIEWLEMGRGVVWGQLSELRIPLDDLRNSHPDIAEKLQRLSAELDDVSQLSTSDLFPGDARRHHRIAHERDQLIEQIRELDGFCDFLKPKKYNDLLLAARSGPVVTINVSQYRCDALVLMPNSSLLHIHLKDFSANDATRLSDTLRGLLRKRSSAFASERNKRRPLISFRNRDGPRINPEDELENILSSLWTQVAQPIITELDIKVTSKEKAPRMWWCLTGSLSFLPIHAAGTYHFGDAEGSKLSDFVVSSYIPSLSALIHCSRPQKPLQQQMLVIGLPLESQLPRVADEINSIADAIEGYPMLRLMDSEATVNNVIDGMKTSSYVHFACHGIQDICNPIDSALFFASGSRLPLSEICKLNLVHGEMAFLSACQTATGDDLLAEESVHLSAGMLSAGYRGVIGTMWSISDEDAPSIAKGVYTHMMQDRSTPMDATRAALALHLAVERLRTESAATKSFFSWVPFVHFGI